MKAKRKSDLFTSCIQRLFASSPSSTSSWRSLSAACLLAMAILGNGPHAYSKSIDSPEGISAGHENFFLASWKADSIIENDRKPILVYLNRKSLGFFNVEVNDLLQHLTKEGHIESQNDLGKTSLFIADKKDLTKFLREEQLPPPPPVKQSLAESGYYVEALYTWEYLAAEFEKEGAEKHRIYIYKEGSMGFLPGKVDAALKNVCERKRIDPATVRARVLNPVDAERRFQIKAVEVIEILDKSP